jgi:hypothetical protein
VIEYYGDSLTTPAQVQLAEVLMSMVKLGLRKQIQELDEKRFQLENGRFARIRYEKDGRRGTPVPGGPARAGHC